MIRMPAEHERARQTRGFPVFVDPEEKGDTDGAATARIGIAMAGLGLIAIVLPNSGVAPDVLVGILLLAAAVVAGLHAARAPRAKAMTRFGDAMLMLMTAGILLVLRPLPAGALMLLLGLFLLAAGGWRLLHVRLNRPHAAPSGQWLTRAVGALEVLFAVVAMVAAVAGMTQVAWLAGLILGIDFILRGVVIIVPVPALPWSS